MEDLWIQVTQSLEKFTLRDAIDIVIVAFVVYKLLVIVRETRAVQGLKGLALLLVAALVCNILNLNTAAWMVNYAIGVGLIALIILFQPELRRVLEQLGRGKLISKAGAEEQDALESIKGISMAMLHMSKQRIGALIVIERIEQLGDHLPTGVRVDSRISSALLETIFYPGTPLHDGAVIIRGTQVLAAGCVLPLSSNKTIDVTLGTRHRAALGISEQSDSVTFVVSEETGTISVARMGVLIRSLDQPTITEILEGIYMISKDENKTWAFIKRKFKRQGKQEKDE